MTMGAAMPTGRKVTEMVINALIGMLATLFLLFGTGAWSRKENAADHARDMQSVMEMQTRTLDILCETPGNAQKRPCTAPKPTLSKTVTRARERFGVALAVLGILTMLVELVGTG
jgi:hypothetical protein